MPRKIIHCEVSFNMVDAIAREKYFKVSCNNVYNTQLLKALREIFVYLQRTLISVKLASIYTLRLTATGRCS